jgi:hypothetical protein
MRSVAQREVDRASDLLGAALRRGVLRLGDA